MARAMMILVSDDHSVVESCRTYAQNQGFSFQSYTNTEWQARSTTQVPSLASGNSPVQEGGKVIPFPGKGVGTMTADGRVKTINEMESEAIEKAIHEFNGNLTEAAKALGIGRATLYRKVKQYNIDPSAARRKRAA